MEREELHQPMGCGFFGHGSIRMEPGAGDVAGGGGIAQDDGTAPIGTASGIAPDNDGGGGQQQGGEGVQPGQPQQAPAQQSWEAQPLPENHPARQRGATTWGQVHQTYQESSRAAREAIAESERIRDTYAQAALELARMRSGQQQQQAPQQAPAGLFGFPSVQAYQLAMKADPEGTMQKVLQHGMQNNPAVQQQIEQMMQQRLQPYQQQMFEQQRQAEYRELSTRYPEFAPDKPLFKTVQDAARNIPWVADIANKVPLEFIFKAFHYDMLQQNNAGANARLQAQRQAAPTARPGAGAAAAPKGGTPEQRVQALAAEWEKAGNPPMTQAQLQDATELLRSVEPKKRT